MIPLTEKLIAVELPEWKTYELRSNEKLLGVIQNGEIPEVICRHFFNIDLNCKVDSFWPKRSADHIKTILRSLDLDLSKTIVIIKKNE